MSLKRIVTVVAFGSAFSLALYTVGCGSSSPGGNGGSGGSTGSGSGGAAGSGGSGGGAGSGSGGSTGSGSGGSAGSGGSGGTSGSPFGDGGPPGDSGGGTCPADTTSYTPMTYTAAVANQGMCATADITAFTTACGDKGTTAKCNTWLTANVAGEAGAGTNCGNCIFAPANNGGIWLDPDEYFSPNYAACIQLTDTTNGATCAPAYDAIEGCVGVACDQCASSAAFSKCESTAVGKGGGCATDSTTFSTACMTDLADGGAAATCSPGAASMTLDPDFTYIINLICGTAP